MSDSFTFGGLNEWQRAEAARHFEVTRHLCYGGAERTKAMYFRLPIGDPDTLDPSPCAALLAALAAAAKAGGTVKLPKLSKADAVRVSELLQQSANRAAREARDGQMTEFLQWMRADWDAVLKTPQNKKERAWHLGIDAARREEKLAMAENKRLRTAAAARGAVEY